MALAAQARAISTDEAILRPPAWELPRLLDQIEVLGRHIATYDEAIARAFAAHPKLEIFAALPGAGPVLAAQASAQNRSAQRGSGKGVGT